MRYIDCRGLNCPEPVLLTRKALAEEPSAGLDVVVDNETARENVMRFAKNQGREAAWQQEGENYRVTISGQEAGQEAPAQQPEAAAVDADEPVLFIATDQLGTGSSELGLLLMRNFIYTLTHRENLPRAIVLMNAGVKLSLADSAVIEELEEMEEKGVQILVCGTCLDYYQLKEQHKTGTVSNMYDISDLLLEASRVITV